LFFSLCADQTFVDLNWQAQPADAEGAEEVNTREILIYNDGFNSLNAFVGPNRKPGAGCDIRRYFIPEYRAYGGEPPYLRDEWQRRIRL
jgi:hypothetical protein